MRDPRHTPVSLFVRRTLATSLSAAALLLAVGEPAQAQGSGADSLQVEEIVVTARKRDESILDTPIAITAVTGEDIAAKGIVSFNALADSTPGITISNVSSGRSDRSFQQITLRGMVPSTTNSTLTATFIDGAPVASATAVASVNDPARIEILRGPQAAYFGRNTFAGAVNVVNKMPGDNLGGSVTLMGGTRSNLDVQGAVDGPIGEKFGFRLSGHFFQKDGSYDNTADTSQTLGDQQTKTMSLLLTAQPTDNFSAKLYTMYSEDDDGPSTQGQLSAYTIRAVSGATAAIPVTTANGVTTVASEPASSAGTLVLPSVSNCNLLGYQFGREATEARWSRPYICGAAPSLPSGFSPAQNTLEDSLLAAALANPAVRVVSPSQSVDGFGLVRQYWHSHLNLDWKIGESGFTVSTLTAINDEYFSEVEDLDNYDTRALANPANPGNALATRRTFWDFLYGVERETRDFSQELRVSYDQGGKFSGVIGVSFLDTLVWNDLVAITNEIVSGTPRVPQAGKSTVETQGVFFGGTYKFTDTFRVTAEGRFQVDDVTGFTGATAIVVSPSVASAFGIAAGPYAPISKLVEEKYENFLPRVIAQYDFNEDLMGYASYSKGVNVGVNTFNTSFLNGSSLLVQTALELGLSVKQEPERLTNYELGLKGKFFDGRVIAQGAAYWGTWSDQLNNRQRIIQDLPVSQGGSGATAQATGFANTGETKVKGLEIEVTAKASEHVDLTFGAAMNDTEIQSYTSPSISQLTGVIGDQFKGKQLPQTAKFSANFGAQYSGNAAFLDDGEWFVRGDLSWKDKQFVDAANLTWIKARTVANFRAGISKGPLAVDAYVLNAFNDDNYVSIAQNSLLTPTFALTGWNGYLNLGLPELRTYGARVSYKF
jgi:iron complex outermembrane recepter protein